MTGGGAAPRKGLNLNELRLKRVYNDKGFLFSSTCILLLVDLKFWSGTLVRPILRCLKNKLFPNKGLCPFPFRQSKRNVFFSYKFHRLEFKSHQIAVRAHLLSEVSSTELKGRSWEASTTAIPEPKGPSFWIWTLLPKNKEAKPLQRRDPFLFTTS